MTKEMTSTEWNAQGVQLFGKHRVSWKFRCPACGNIQTVANFTDLVKFQVPPTAVLLVCRKFFDQKCSFDATKTFHPDVVIVTNDDGKRVPTLPFATE